MDGRTVGGRGGMHANSVGEVRIPVPELPHVVQPPRKHLTEHCVKASRLLMKRPYSNVRLHHVVQPPRKHLPKNIRQSMARRFNIVEIESRETQGWGTAEAEDAQGTPTQSHISPTILV